MVLTSQHTHFPAHISGVISIIFAFAERLLATLIEVFLWFFLICKAKVRVYNAEFGHGPHFPAPGAAASPKYLTQVVYLEFATEPVWAKKPESQPTEVTSSVLPRH